MPRYRFSHEGIMCDTYTPSTNVDLNKAGLILLGYPATIGENRITNMLIENGYTAYQPHYPGTYDSSGEFDPNQSIQMVSSIVKGVKRGEVVNLKSQKKILTSRKIKICIGYSFGCIIALKSMAMMPDVDRLILLAPVISYGPSKILSGFNTPDISFLDYLRRTRPFTYRLGKQKEWEKLFNGYYNDVKNNSEKNNIKHVFGIVGEKDNYFDIKVLQENFKTIIRQYVGNSTKINLLTIKDAGHSSSDLLSSNDDQLQDIF